MQSCGTVRHRPVSVGHVAPCGQGDMWHRADDKGDMCPLQSHQKQNEDMYAQVAWSYTYTNIRVQVPGMQWGRGADNEAQP